tara:strand:+ start:336 stop:458 length:123 start_codon:yes stop_codon:yes gene_type:complete
MIFAAYPASNSANANQIIAVPSGGVSVKMRSKPKELESNV